MEANAPFLLKIVFYCPTCEKKRSANADVVIKPGKNYFSFMCTSCGSRWIVDIFQTMKEKEDSVYFPVQIPGTTEPQTKVLVNFTNELQPLMKKRIIDPKRFRIIKSMGKTIEVNALGIKEIPGADRSDIFIGLKKLNEARTAKTKAYDALKGTKK
jgi:hypothetical protein